MYIYPPLHLPYFLLMDDQDGLPGQFVHLGWGQLVHSGGGQLVHPGGCLEVAKPSLRLESTSWTLSSPWTLPCPTS